MTNINELRQRLGAVSKVERILKDESKVDVAPERVLSSEAESNIAGIELQDLSGETTELQKRTLNRGLKPAPIKNRSEFSSSEEAIKYLERVNDPVRIKEQNHDDFERMRSQYISEDNIKKNKWAKLKTRLARIYES